MLDDAERIVVGMRNGSWKAVAFADIAQLLASIEPSHASALADQAERAAAVTNEAGSTLAAIAQAIVDADPDRATDLAEQAEVAAARVPLDYQRVWALVGIAREWLGPQLP
jgi:hypothetical protein